MTALSWLTSHWRLKLLALVMSLALLGTVAFAQNPLQIRSVNAPILYKGSPPDSLMVVDPPSTAAIPVTGLGTDVSGLNANNIAVVVDLAKVRAGQAQTVTGIPSISSAAVTAQVDEVPIRLD